MLEAGQRAGVLTDDEHRMLQRLLRFRNRIAKETMAPRLDVVAVSADANLETAIETCLDGGFTQLPVYEDALDTVIGIVHVLDLLSLTRSPVPWPAAHLAIVALHVDGHARLQWGCLLGGG